VIVYVDGFNLYYGLKSSSLRRFYWLDLALLCERLCLSTQRLVRANYFTSRVSGGKPTDSPSRRKDKDESRARQTAYLDVLAEMPNLRIREGQFLEKQRSCAQCRAVATVSEEKMTDVLIATTLMVDACQDDFDTAIVVSGDSDLCPPIEQVIDLYGKRVVVAFPPGRSSSRLKSCASAFFVISENNLRNSQLPSTVALRSGRSISRPACWS
jgi:uncharacterized LabA/DUF88 family protein